MRNGSFRIETPFLYPDGSNIDLFLDCEVDLFGNRILSDMGQTATFLIQAQVEFWRTTRRRKIITAICKLLNVEEDSGVLQVRLSSEEVNQGIGAHIARLGQACVRAADLIVTRRLQVVGVFREGVEEFLASNSFPFEWDVLLPGKYDKKIRVDCQVGANGSGGWLIQTLSAASDPAFHQSSLEIYTKWRDLATYKDQSHSHFMTLIDSSMQTKKHEDIKRLAEESDVIFFPQNYDRLTRALLLEPPHA